MCAGALPGFPTLMRTNMPDVRELERHIRDCDDLTRLPVRVIPTPGAREMNANSKIVQIDATCLEIDLGSAVVTVFGKTESGEWMYFATTYDRMNRPVA